MSEVESLAAEWYSRHFRNLDEIEAQSFFEELVAHLDITTDEFEIVILESLSRRKTILHNGIERQKVSSAWISEFLSGLGEWLYAFDPYADGARRAILVSREAITEAIDKVWLNPASDLVVIDRATWDYRIFHHFGDAVGGRLSNTSLSSADFAELESIRTRCKASSAARETYLAKRRASK